jgi:enediyne biosynthesis protein E4
VGRSSLLVLLILACSAPKEDAAVVDSGEPVPPAICRTPSVPASYFTDVTEEWGASGFLSTGIIAGDLDGDGLPDLLAAVFPNAREPDPSKRTRFVLMNRNGKFVDESDASGLMATRDGVGGRGWSTSSLGDLDNDGDLDVILCPAGGDTMTLDPCDAFLNDGKGHFTLAPSSQLNDTIFWTTSTTMVDIDRDGILDFFPGTAGRWFYGPMKLSAPRLYKGAGDGTFVNVAQELGLPATKTTATNYRANFGIAACDLDGDGNVELITANYGRQMNEVYVLKNGKFEEKGAALGIASDDRVDFTDDNSYRCYCKENAGACPSTVQPPATGLGCRGWIPGVSDQPHALGGNTFSITCGDIDDDGDLDLMTAEVRHGDVGSSSDFSELLINNGGLTKFTRPDKLSALRPHTGLLWNEGDNIGLFADLDLDGRKDILLAASNYPDTKGVLYHQKADGSFEALDFGHPSAEGPALADIDGDGDLDLIIGTGTFNGAAKTNALHVYRNDVTSNFVKIRLVGKGAGFANRTGIGARVKVTAGGRTQYQDLFGSFGHSGSQHDTVLTFGLGSACAVDAIEVRWPNGNLTTQNFKDVRANYLVELREGDPVVHYPGGGLSR